MKGHIRNGILTWPSAEHGPESQFAWAVLSQQLILILSVDIAKVALWKPCRLPYFSAGRALVGLNQRPKTRSWTHVHKLPLLTKLPFLSQLTATNGHTSAPHTLKVRGFELTEWFVFVYRRLS
jgi:hypothetical protein